jgi:hypothetical protein
MRRRDESTMRRAGESEWAPGADRRPHWLQRRLVTNLEVAGSVFEDFGEEFVVDLVELLESDLEGGLIFAGGLMEILR